MSSSRLVATLLAVAVLLPSAGEVGAVPVEPEMLVSVTAVVDPIGRDLDLLGMDLVSLIDGVDGVDVTQTLDGLGLVTVEASTEGLSVLEESGLVAEISTSRPLELLLDASTVIVESDEVNAAGHDGTGRVVVVIDSGVDSSHPALSSRIVDEACFVIPLPEESRSCPNGQSVQFGSGAASPCSASGCAHGTHVAGIVASTDSIYRGVAPGVGIIPIRVADEGGSIGTPDVLAALNHVYEIRALYDIAAVNLSLGDPNEPGDCRDPLFEAVVAELAAAGIAVVAASGNSADIPEVGISAVSFPACLPGVVSVGATERSSHLGLAADGEAELAEFTQYLGTLDLVAPGFDIASTVSPGDGFAAMSGTSMAAPHVAAAFAVLSDTQSGWTPDRYEALLRTTGQMVERHTLAEGDRHRRYPELRLSDAVEFDPFDDAKGGFWVSAADWAKYAEVSGGIGDNLFGPQQATTRAQVVTLLWRLMGSPQPSQPSGFEDVPDNEFYTDAVDWAAELEVTAGRTPSTFDPAARVTRGELATFLWRLVGRPPSPPSGFSDVATESFYSEPIGWMVAHGITLGTSPTTFSPVDAVTRAQVITFLWRLMNAPDAWSSAPKLPDAVLF